MPENDSVMRAMTNDGAFRVIAARTTDTVRSVVAAQNLSGALAHDMADLLSTAVLYRETMAPSLRVQCIVRFDEEAVRSLSPVRHIPQDPCPLVIACADGDLDEFQRQSKTFAQAWEAGDGDAQFIRYARHNHFSLTLELADATSEAMQAFLALIEQPPV